MSRKKKKSADNQPAPIRWEVDPDVPTHDFFESGSLDNMWNLQEAVDSFVHWLEEDRFLTWKAVACERIGNLIPRFSRTGNLSPDWRTVNRTNFRSGLDVFLRLLGDASVPERLR